MSGSKPKAYGSLAAAALASLLLAASLAAAAGASATTVPGPCGNRAIWESHTQVDGAMGHGVVVLLFKNTSNASCTLVGYPGLDAIGRRGNVLAHAARTRSGMTGPGVVRTIVIRPGRYRVGRSGMDELQSAQRRELRLLDVDRDHAAHTTATVKFRLSVSICDLQIHPVVAGTSGIGR